MCVDKSLIKFGWILSIGLVDSITDGWTVLIIKLPQIFSEFLKENPI